MKKLVDSSDFMNLEVYNSQKILCLYLSIVTTVIETFDFFNVLN